MAGKNVDIRMAAGPIVGTDMVSVDTPIFDTTEFSLASLQATVLGMLGGNNTNLSIETFLSNDGVHWLTSPAGVINFNMGVAGPFSQTQIQIQNSLAAFLRCRISVTAGGMSPTPVGATVNVRAIFKTST